MADAWDDATREFIDQQNGWGGTPQQNTNTLYKKLLNDKDLNLPPAAVAGVVGSGYDESKNSGGEEDRRTVSANRRPGLGIFQLTDTPGSPRRTEFETWAKNNGRDPNSLQSQYDFFKQDLLRNPRFLRQLQSQTGTDNQAYGVVRGEYEFGKGLPAPERPVAGMTWDDATKEFISNQPTPDAPAAPQSQAAPSQPQNAPSAAPNAAPAPAAAPAAPQASWGAIPNTVNAGFFGTLPRVAAGIASGMPDPVTGMALPPQMTQGTTEPQALAQINAQKEQWQKANPLLNAATDVLGNALTTTPFATAAAGGIANLAAKALPDTMLGRAAAGVVGGGIAGAAQGASDVTSDTRLPWRAAWGAAGGTLFGGLTGAMSPSANAVPGYVKDVLNTVMPDTGKSVGDSLGLKADQITSSFGRGQAYSTPEQLQNFNQVTAKVGKLVDDQGNPAQFVSPQSIKSTLDYAGKRLDDAAMRTGVTRDAKMDGDLQDVARWVAKNSAVATDADASRMRRITMAVTKALQPGHISGEEYQGLTQRGGLIDSAISDSNPMVQQLGQRLRSLVNDGLERSSPQIEVGMLRQARGQYRTAMDLQKLGIRADSPNFPQAVANKFGNNPNSPFYQLAQGAHFIPARTGPKAPTLTGELFSAGMGALAGQALGVPREGFIAGTVSPVLKGLAHAAALNYFKGPAYRNLLMNGGQIPNGVALGGPAGLVGSNLGLLGTGQ